MIFDIIDEKEYTKYESKHELGSFYQTTKWGNFKKNNGWIPYYVGVKKNNKLIGASLLLKKNVFKQISIIYAPRGYLLDYNNYDLLSFFSNEIKKFAKKHHSIFVKIDPFVLTKELDKNGDEVSNGINNEKIIDNLLSLNYKKDKNNLQPDTVFKLYFNGNTKEELFNKMETTTRQSINKAKKIGITTRFIELNEMPKFKDVMESTAKRREFVDRPLSYYENMYKVFKDDVKFMVAEINIKEYLKKLNSELKTTKEDITKLEESLKDENANIKKKTNQIKELIIIKESLNKKISYAKKIKESNESDIITLGALMFMLHNKDVISLFGGAYGEYRDFMPAYLLNYDMICYAKDNGFESYNFYGISEYKDKNNEMYGLYDFKRGFDGVVEKYIGEYNLITNKFLYFMYNKIYNGLYLKIKKKMH